MSRNRALLWAVLIVLLALALRWRHAGRRESLWGDEAQNIGIVESSTSLGDVWRRVQREGHPPLHYWVEWTVERAFGGTLRVRRGMTILFGTLSVALVLVLGWRRFGPRCGLLAGGLAATSPYLIHYSTEIRSYALFGLLGVVHAFAYLRFLRRPGAAAAAAWGVTAALMAYCHYYGLHIALAGGLYAVARDPTRRTVLHVGVAGLVGAALFAPWLPHFVWQMRTELQAWYEPRSRMAMLLSLFFRPFGKWGALLLAWGLVRSIMLVRRGDTAPDEALAFRGLFWTTVGASVVAWIAHGFHGGNYLPRYLIAMVVPLFVPACLYWSRMGSLGPVTWRGRWTGRTFTLEPPRLRRLAGVLVVVAVLLQYTDPAKWLRQPSPAAMFAARVERHERPGDLIIVSPAWFGLSFGFHYRGALPVAAPPYRSPLPPYIDHVDLFEKVHDADLGQEFIEGFRRHLEGGGRVWLVALGSFPLDSQRPFQDKPAPKRTAALVRSQRALHLRLMRLLYERARATYWLEGPSHEFIMPLALILFDPAERR